jgi:hypothetical protein
MATYAILFLLTWMYTFLRCHLLNAYVKWSQGSLPAFIPCLPACLLPFLILLSLCRPGGGSAQPSYPSAAFCGKDRQPGYAPATVEPSCLCYLCITELLYLPAPASLEVFCTLLLFMCLLHVYYCLYTCMYSACIPVMLYTTLLFLVIMCGFWIYVLSCNPVCDITVEC